MVIINTPPEKKTCGKIGFPGECQVWQGHFDGWVTDNCTQSLLTRRGTGHQAKEALWPSSPGEEPAAKGRLEANRQLSKENMDGWAQPLGALNCERESSGLSKQ